MASMGKPPLRNSVAHATRPRGPALDSLIAGPPECRVREAKAVAHIPPRTKTLPRGGSLSCCGAWSEGLVDLVRIGALTCWLDRHDAPVRRIRTASLEFHSPVLAVTTDFGMADSRCGRTTEWLLLITARQPGASSNRPAPQGYWMTGANLTQTTGHARPHRCSLVVGLNCTWRGRCPDGNWLRGGTSVSWAMSCSVLGSCASQGPQSARTRSQLRRRHGRETIASFTPLLPRRGSGRPATTQSPRRGTRCLI